MILRSVFLELCHCIFYIYLILTINDQKYLQYLEDNRIKYLFPKISNDKKFLKKEKNNFYNLVNMIGHLGPNVTLRYYSHIDYILHFHNVKNLF